MIAYLKGKLAFIEPSRAIIECNGIGYECRISLNTYEKLGKAELVHIHTHFMVREDAHTLFGFAEPDERALFEQLIGISGVGGNTALTILSSISAVDLQRAIETEDVNTIKGVKGIGPKTAGRIILELKGKLKLADGQDGSGASLLGGNRRSEALAALLSLGFTKSAMEKKIDQILKSDPEATVESIIKLALRG